MTQAELDSLATLSDEWRMEAKEVERVANADTRVRVEALTGCAEALSHIVRAAVVTPDPEADEVDADEDDDAVKVGDLDAPDAEGYAGHGPMKRAGKKR